VAGEGPGRQALDDPLTPVRPRRTGDAAQARHGLNRGTRDGRARRQTGGEHQSGRGRGAPADGRPHRRIGPQREPRAGDRLCRVQLRHEANDVLAADKPGPRHRRRRVPEPGVLLFYSPEEIEAISRSLQAGFHRPAVSTRGELEHFEDDRDSEAIRVAAYSGLRLGELLALPWRDVDWTGSALTISRSLSSGVEGTTKTGHVRRVPMADQAAAALDRLSQRQDFVSPDDYVFCNALGRPLDGSALRRRYKRARDAAGLRPLRWHDLRHTFGSLLVAGGVDLVSIKDAMGHSQLTTTSRYLHARPATERAAAFTAAFQGGAATAPSFRGPDTLGQPDGT
jgi:integrase